MKWPTQLFKAVDDNVVMVLIQVVWKCEPCLIIVAAFLTVFFIGLFDNIGIRYGKVLLKHNRLIQISLDRIIFC